MAEELILIYYSTTHKEVYMNPHVDARVLSDSAKFIDRDDLKYRVRYYDGVHNIAFAVEE